MRRNHVIFLLSVVLVIAGVQMAFAMRGAPPVFSDLSVEQAIEQSKEQGKLLIVDAMADWCMPCKQMDRTTWVDKRVVAWLDEHAIAIQCDTDKERAFATEHAISAIPTVLAFRDGAVFDRTVGYRSADELLAWLEDVKAGKSSRERLAERAGDRAGKDGRVDIKERLDLARELARANEFDAATDEYVWLWQNMLEHQPSMVGVRSSFMASDMKSLAAQSEKAKAAFTKLRDDSGARLERGPTSGERDDWIVLNEVIGDDDATLAWFDLNKDDPLAQESIRRSMFRIKRLFKKHGRHADYGRFVEDPAAQVRSVHTNTARMLQFLPEADAEQRAIMVEFANRRFREEVAYLHAALLTADRDDEAWEVVDTALELSDTPEMREAFVAQATLLGQVQDRHASLIKE